MEVSSGRVDVVDEVVVVVVVVLVVVVVVAVGSVVNALSGTIWNPAPFMFHANMSGSYFDSEIANCELTVTAFFATSMPPFLLKKTDLGYF